MRRPATPREFEELLAALDGLDYIDRDQRAGIARMVFEAVSDCPVCEEGVRRCDPRRLVDDRLHHLDCVGGA